VQIWTIISLGWKRAYERYGHYAFCASLVWSLVYLFFGVCAEKLEKYMSAWILIIPLVVFIVLFIFECGRAYQELKNKNKDAFIKIQQNWLQYGRHGRTPPRD
jgi:membrane protein DedA with SNARE-associated domain